MNDDRPVIFKWSRMAGTLLVILYGMAIVWAGLGAGAEGAGSRPRIQGHTVYTAQGTPLRGTMISTEGNAPGTFLMTEEEMRELTQNGLNAIHIYAERRSDGKPVGASAENCDDLIAKAEKNHMVAILTVGEFNLEADSMEREIQFIYDFWEFYAARYGDRENVIFEICNEMPTMEVSAEVEAKAYEIVRRHAPDTPVLFYSFSLTDPIGSILSHVQALETHIGDRELWTNAALAFHGYESQEDLKGADHFRNVIHTLTRAGYPLINTELPNRFENSHYPDTALLKVCEEEGISWLSFVSWERITVPSIWRGQVEAAGIAWEADHGDWPIPDALHPFRWHLAWETAESTPAEFVEEYRFIAYKLSVKDQLVFRRLHFGTREPNGFCVTAKVEGSGTLSVYAGAESGVFLGQCRIGDTGGKYAEFPITLHAPVSGLQDISIVYKPDRNGQLFVKSWRFTLPEQSGYSNPYENTVFAAEYPFRTGGVKRAPCTDSGSEAIWQVEGITDGSSLLFDFVEFHGKAAILHIRAMSIGGGRIAVTAGDDRMQVYELGEVEINGPSGAWAEYTCVLTQEEILMFDPVKQYLDLRLAFSGKGEGELFALSEFWFEEWK